LVKTAKPQVVYATYISSMQSSSNLQSIMGIELTESEVILI